MIPTILERFGVPPRRAAAQARPGGLPFPNVILRTHRNRVVRFYDDVLAGKLVIISFMYTRCENICPPTIASVRRLQDALGTRAGRDVFLYSITLDPVRDTREVLEDFARTVGAGPGWAFLTGIPDDIELIRRRLGFVDPNPIVDADKAQHSGLLLIGNERTDRWAACPAPARTERILKLISRIEA
jgi:protein SCO1/2